jgi:hypothetical protein
MVPQTIDTAYGHNHIHYEQPPIAARISPRYRQNVTNEPQFKCEPLVTNHVPTVQDGPCHTKECTRNQKEGRPINHQEFQHTLSRPSLLCLPSLLGT